MKYLKKNILFIAALIFIAAPNAVFAGEVKTKIVVEEKDSTKNDVVCYEVFGMDCPGCHSALEKQLKKIEGVADAKASFKDKEVVIEMKPGAEVSEEEIAKRIKKANFTPGKKKPVGNNEE